MSTLLDGILERGIEKLLQEVKLKNYTQAPYGRDPEPSPLLSEEAFLQNGCLEEEGDDEPRFDFSYGFSPLQFLADYVRWSHPDSVKERRLERIRCVERLQALAVHAKRQLSTASTLRNIAMAQGSGVVWGPMCAARSPTAVNAVLQLNRAGTLFVEVATDASFQKLHKVETVEVDSVELPLQVLLQGLLPGTQYHLRAYLDDVNLNKEPPAVLSSLDASVIADDSVAADEAEAAAAAANDAAALAGMVDADGSGPEESAASASVEGGGEGEEKTQGAETGERGRPLPELFLAQSCVVSTPPLTGDEEEGEGAEANAEANAEQAAPSSITLACLPADCARSSSLSAEAVGGQGGYLATCLLGDPFDNHAAQEADGAGYTVDSWGVYCASQLLTQASSVCRNGGLFLGWNDTRLGSDVDARSEEVTHKQFMHDLKKHTKKHAKHKGGGGKKDPPPPPEHKRPALSRSLQSLSQTFPVSFAELGASRSLHKSTRLGPELELFELDVRGGYLPKDQVKWIKDAISASQAQWKVVLVGSPLSIGLAPEVVHAAEEKEKHAVAPVVESKEGEAAAKAVVVEAPEGHDTHKENKDQAKHAEQVDEEGRPKHSLHYVIASLQRSHERHVAAAKAEAAAAAAEEEEEGGEQKGAEAGEAEGAPFSAAEEAEAKEGVVQLESGLVFVTSVSGASGLPMQPFLATFDPAATGRAYCAEVSVGGSIPSAAAARTRQAEGGQAPLTQVVPRMQTSFVFNAPDSADSATDNGAADHSAVLRLEADGDLSVRVLRLSSSTHPDADPSPAEVVSRRFRLSAAVE